MALLRNGVLCIQGWSENQVHKLRSPPWIPNPSQNARPDAHPNNNPNRNPKPTPNLNPDPRP